MKNRRIVAVLFLFTGLCVGYSIRSLLEYDCGKPLCTHSTKHLVFHCMDHRFLPLDRIFIRDYCGGDADLLSWPGAIKCLNSDEPIKKKALEALGFAVEKHGVTDIHIINHLDCGGYGGSKEHANATAEERFHREELLRAEKEIKSCLPGVLVHKYLETFEGIKKVENDPA